MKGFISIIFILILFLSACGSIGTDTGNPELPQQDDATQSAPEFSSGHGVTYEMPADWILENSDSAITTGDSGGSEDGSEIIVEMLILGNVDSSVESTVTIYVILLNETPTSLEEYLQTERPSVTFDTYANDNLSGFIYDDPTPGSNGGDLKEIYFLKDNTLLYIVAELFEGSGSTEAEIILSSINFAE